MIIRYKMYDITVDFTGETVPLRDSDHQFVLDCLDDLAMHFYAMLPASAEINRELVIRLERGRGPVKVS